MSCSLVLVSSMVSMKDSQKIDSRERMGVRWRSNAIPKTAKNTFMNDKPATIHSRYHNFWPKTVTAPKNF